MKEALFIVLVVLRTIATSVAFTLRRISPLRPVENVEMRSRKRPSEYSDPPLPHTHLPVFLGRVRVELDHEHVDRHRREVNRLEHLSPRHT